MPKKKPDAKPEQHEAEKDTEQKPREKERPARKVTRHGLTLDEVNDLILPGGPSEEF